MSNAQIQYEQGIAAVKSKDFVNARKLLRDSLKSDPSNDRAWLWLSRAVEDDETKLKCIERALRLNPDSDVGHQMHRHLLQKMGLDMPEAEDAGEQDAQADSAEAAAPEKAKDIPMGKEVASAGIRAGYQTRKVAGLAAFGLVTLMMLPSAPRYLREPSVSVFVLLMLLMFGGFAVTFGVLLATTPFGKRFRIFENGIAFGDKKTGILVRWHELDGIIKLRDIELSTQVVRGLMGLVFQDMGFYRLNGIKDGKVIFSLTRDFEDYREIGETILKLSEPHLVDRYINEWKKTRKLVLGSLTLDKDGITDGKTRVAYKNILETLPYASSVAIKTLDSRTVNFSISGIAITGKILADIIMAASHMR